MMRSLYSAVSGIGVNQQSMDVIGNNIANVNTVGYKMGRAVFEDLLSQTLSIGSGPSGGLGGINSKQIGTGAYIASIDNIFSAGISKNTEKGTDLSIAGDGFFIVREGGTQRNFYTRAGDFNFDKSMNFTNPSGYFVQGWMADPVTGVIQYNSLPTDMALSNDHLVMQARATSEIDYKGLLDNYATGSVSTFDPMYTLPSGGNNIYDVTGISGKTLGLNKSRSDVINVQMHAIGTTGFNQAFNSGGQSLGMSLDNSNIILKINGVNYTFHYSADPLKTNNFTTLSELATRIQGVLTGSINDTTATVTVTNGRLTIQGGSTQKFSIDDITTSSQYLPTVLAPLKQSYAGGTVQAQPLFVKRTLTTGVDFSNLNELATDISTSVSSVYQNGFSAEYLENQFGMVDGEKLSLQVNNIPTLPTSSSHKIVLNYTKSPTPDLSQLQFNSLDDLANLIQREVNTVAANTINVSVVNGRLRFNSPATGVSISDVSSPSTYLNNALAKVEGVSLPPAGSTTIVQTDDISVKGKIVYSNVSNTNFLSNIFGLRDGETVSIITSDGAPTPTYTTNTFTYRFNPSGLGANEFSDEAGFASLLQTTFGFNSVVFNNPGPNNFSINNTGGPTVRIQSFSTPSDTLNGILGSIFTAPYPFVINTGDTPSTAVNMTVPRTFTRVATSPDVTGFSITKQTSGGNFNEIMISGSPAQPGSDYDGVIISAGSTISSDQFMTFANDNTLMYDLLTKNGIPAGFATGGTTLEFTAEVGDKILTDNQTYTVTKASRMKDMMDALAFYLGVGSSNSKSKNVTIANGQITVNGEKGIKNDIKKLQFKGLPDSSFVDFNNDYNSPSRTQPAEGGFTASAVTIFDGQGGRHNINFEYAMHNETLNEWTVTINTTEPNTSLSINEAVTNELVVRFNADGTISYIYDRFANPPRVISNPSLSFDAGNGSDAITKIDLNFGTPGKNDGLHISQSSGSGFDISGLQNGYPIGDLREREFNEKGELVGSYSNDQKRVIGQIALANFTNNQGLIKVGGTMFSSGPNSGDPQIGTPTSGARGKISPSTLESSNVNLSEEFVNMITTQRGFQANSRVVTTSDEMLQELLNLKR